MKSFNFSGYLEKNLPAPVYLFKGEADFLMEDAWSMLLEKVVPSNARRFNGERLSAKECSAEQVVLRLSTLPMFGGKSLVMVQHVEGWPKEQLKVIQSYVAHPHPSACLVLTANPKKGADKLEAAITAAGGVVVEFSAPSERDAPKWLQERARHQKKRLSPQAASMLIEQVGIDLFRMERELEKLCLYVGPRNVIDVEDVKEVVGLQRSFTVFELLRYVGKRQGVQAVTSLRSLILAGESPLGILALLTLQIRRLWQVKDAMERGTSAAQIAQQLKLHPFVVKGYTEQISHFTVDGLHRIHRRLCEADLTLKQTGIAPETILEALVLDLCRREQKLQG
jgi:DNA polymerase-3 subunit delta